MLAVCLIETNFKTLRFFVCIFIDPSTRTYSRRVSDLKILFSRYEVKLMVEINTYVCAHCVRLTLWICVCVCSCKFSVLSICIFFNLSLFVFVFVFFRRVVLFCIWYFITSCWATMLGCCAKVFICTRYSYQHLYQSIVWWGG